jgi:hypothetical protein
MPDRCVTIAADGFGDMGIFAHGACFTHFSGIPPTGNRPRDLVFPQEVRILSLARLLYQPAADGCGVPHPTGCLRP